VANFEWTGWRIVCFAISICISKCICICICIWIWIWTDARLDSLSGGMWGDAICVRDVPTPFASAFIFYFLLYFFFSYYYYFSRCLKISKAAPSHHIKTLPHCYIGASKVSANLSAMSFVVSPQSAYHNHSKPKGWGIRIGNGIGIGICLGIGIWIWIDGMSLRQRQQWLKSSLFAAATTIAS